MKNKDEVLEIIEQFNLENNDKIKKRIDKIIEVEKYCCEALWVNSKNLRLNEFGLRMDGDTKEEFRQSVIRNEKIFRQDCLDYLYFPDTQAPLSIFILLYKKGPIPATVLSSFNSQYAKQIENLRKRNGCIFTKSREKKSYEEYKNKIRCRNLLGFDFTFKDLSINGYLKCNKKKLDKYEKNKKCIITGTKRSVERDHRIPCNAARELGILPAIITNESIDNRGIEKDFQYISREINDKKREACIGCLSGDKIKVLPVAEKKQKQGIFISYWCRDCTKCFWYDIIKAYD